MLTKDLNIPNKPSDQPSGWSIRHLLFLSGSVSKVMAAFNPFEFIFFIMILISGIAEILDRSVSWIWYVLVFLVLLVVFTSRQKVEQQKEDKPVETKK